MSSWAVYYVYDEGEKEYVESFTDQRDAHAERDRLQAAIEDEIDNDGTDPGVRVRVIEEP